jgi:hypothetical protein
MKDTEGRPAEVYSLFPNSTPDNENEKQISLVETLVDDNDVTLL